MTGVKAHLWIRAAGPVPASTVRMAVFTSVLALACLSIVLGLWRPTRVLGWPAVQWLLRIVIAPIAAAAWYFVLQARGTIPVLGLSTAGGRGAIGGLLGRAFGRAIRFDCATARIAVTHAADGVNSRGVTVSYTWTVHVSDRAGSASLVLRRVYLEPTDDVVATIRKFFSDGERRPK